MKAQDRRKLLAAIGVILLILVADVMLTALAAEMRQENNILMTSNETLQGEVDTLNVKIKTASSVDHIEELATEKYGMVHPTSEQCVYITGEDRPEADFASVIRREAYD